MVKIWPERKVTSKQTNPTKPSGSTRGDNGSPMSQCDMSEDSSTEMFETDRIPSSPRNELKGKGKKRTGRELEQVPAGRQGQQNKRRRQAVGAKRASRPRSGGSSPMGLTPESDPQEMVINNMTTTSKMLMSSSPMTTETIQQQTYSAPNTAISRVPDYPGAHISNFTLSPLSLFDPHATIVNTVPEDAHMSFHSDTSAANYDCTVPGQSALGIPVEHQFAHQSLNHAPQYGQEFFRGQSNNADGTHATNTAVNSPAMHNSQVMQSPWFNFHHS